MQDILKKALDEAFTAKWAAELEECDDKGVAFSPAVELEMKKTVKKADHPVLFYTNYIAAAAACAVIAVAAAFIMPLFTSGKIDVDKPSATNTVQISEPVSEEQDAAVTDISAAPTEEVTSDTEQYAIAGDIPDDESIDSDDQQTEGTVQSTDTTLPPIEETLEGDDENVINDDPNDYGPDNSDEEWPEMEVEDNEDIDEAVVEDAPVYDDEDDGRIIPIIGDGDFTDDAAIGGDVAALTDDDDDLNPATGGGIPSIDDGDYDDDLDMDGDDCDSDYDEDIPNIPSTETGKRFPYPDSATLGTLFRNISGSLNYSDLCVHTGYYVTGGRNYMLYTGGEYMNEFIRNSANAQFFSRECTPTASYIKLTVCDAPIARPNIVTKNSSAWLRYNDIYYNGYRPDDDFDIDADDEDDYETSFSATLIVYKNGLVSVEEILDFSTGSTKKYVDKMYFKADSADVSKLFAKADGTLLPSGVSTVGDLISAMNITSANIKDAVFNVDGIYDSSIYGMKVPGSTIAELFAANSQQRISALGSSGRFVYGTFTLYESSTNLRLSVTSDKCMIRTNDGDEIMFPITESSFDNFMISAASANGFSIPVYKTLYEFVAGKNFTKVDSAYVRNSEVKYSISDSADTEVLYNAMVNELTSAQYCINKYNRAATQYVCLKVRGWGYDLLIFSDDTIQIGQNVFMGSSGLYNRMKTIIVNSSSVMGASAFSLYATAFELPDGSDENPNTDDIVPFVDSELPDIEDPVIFDDAVDDESD